MNKYIFYLKAKRLLMKLAFIPGEISVTAPLPLPLRLPVFSDHQ
jgi:hypothetical protein